MTARISLNLGRTCNFGAFAAERRKNVAPGASPGFVLMSNSAPEGRKTRRIFRPSGAGRLPTNYPGLAPGATFLSRSAAGTAAQQSPKMANLQRADIDRRKGRVAREGETRKSGSFNFRIIGGLNQPPRLRPLRRLRGIF